MRATDTAHKDGYFYRHRPETVDDVLALCHACHRIHDGWPGQADPIVECDEALRYLLRRLREAVLRWHQRQLSVTSAFCDAEISSVQDDFSDLEDRVNRIVDARADLRKQVGFFKQRDGIESALMLRFFLAVSDRSSIRLALHEVVDGLDDWIERAAEEVVNPPELSPEEEAMFCWLEKVIEKVIAAA